MLPQDDDSDALASSRSPGRLLDEIPTERSRRRIYRLASISPDEEFLARLGLDALSQQELKDLLEASGHLESLKEVFDAPFRRKRRLVLPTRFSDGSYPVFYSSLDSATAEAEVGHWFMKTFSGRPQHRRTAYYQRFACSFEGSEKDLRNKRSEWLELVHGDDYTFCNRIGAEAIQLGLDGLVAPSARRATGSNVPVFTRQAVSNPESQGVVTIAFDPRKGEFTAASENPS